MQSKMQKWSSGVAVVGLVFIALVIGGCKGSKSNSLSLTDPNSATFQPKGTIQGKVRDTITLQPVVGALVSVGLATDVTDAQGQYVLANIPATTDALNGTVSGHYDITIDLRSVSSPVKMGTAVSATNPHYPTFSYLNVSVLFTSLNDANPCQDGTNPSVPPGGTTCGTNNTNHDTPVSGLVGNGDVFVGKLDSTIKGTVVGCPTLTGFALLPLSGYTVQLVTSASNGDTGTGSTGNVVNTVTTDASGNFEFDYVEAGASFAVHATDTAASASATVSGWSPAVVAPADLQTSVVLVNNPVTACTLDNLGPVVVATSPENGSEQNPGATSVTFKFNEAVALTPYSDPVNTVVGLTNSVKVVFDGNTVINPGNGSFLPSTASWNATMDLLTVSFTTGTSGAYHVTILNAPSMQDLNGNPVQMGVCPDDSAVPWSTFFTSGGSNDCTVFFTTNDGGVGAPAAPVVTVLDAANLDQSTLFGGTHTAVMDWAPVTGAKWYNFYCSTDEIFSDGTIQLGTVSLIAGNGNNQAIMVSSLSWNTGGFVEIAGGQPTQIGLQYSCFVRGANSDGIEGASSNTFVLKDAKGPYMSNGSLNFNDQNSDGNIDTIIIYFVEPINELTASVPGNYKLSITGFTAPAVLGARLLPSGDAVQLSISDTLTQANLQGNAANKITVTGVTDLAGNVISTGGDEIDLATAVVH
ncbi:MAG: Ig-like domain-containing protein [Nitrospirae bacterium]|nr:Ig-like domain-containing protein [Nitrospirota bacterium]